VYYVLWYRLIVQSVHQRRYQQTIQYTQHKPIANTPNSSIATILEVGSLSAGVITYRVLNPYSANVENTVSSQLYSKIYPTRCNVTQFILSGNYSTCFGWYHHPSSGTQTTVSTASGICHTVSP